MRVLLTAVGCLAIGAATTIDLAQAQGPVRSGLRAAGEATAEGTRRIVEGGANVVGGVAQGTANVAGGVAQGAVDVTRGVVGAAARRVDALTPGIPYQARAGANLPAADAAREARWRFARHNGEWWYYTPQNAWMYHRDGQWNDFAADSFQPSQQFAGEYSSAYRGPESGEQYGAQGGQQLESQYGDQQYGGPVYRLRYDEQGREFICENGRRVYFDEGQGGQQHQVGYGGEGMTGPPDQPTPTPAIPQDPNSAGVEAPSTGGQSTTTGQAGAGVPTTPGAAQQ